MSLVLLCFFLLAFFSQCLGSHREKHLRVSFLWDDLDSKRPLNNSAIFITPNLNYDKKRTLTTQNSSSNFVKIKCTPNKLTSSNGYENVTIFWYNINYSPNYFDFIAIYSPEDSLNDKYLDFFYVNSVINGSYVVRLWNLRSNYSIKYFRNEFDIVYTLKGESNVVVNPKQPLQTHLSLTENSPFEMEVMWVSSLVDSPKLKLGTKSGEYNEIYENIKFWTYNASEMCGNRAGIVSPTRFRDPGYMYDIILHNLTENTTYYYIVGSDDYWSIEYNFTTSISSENNINIDSSFKFIMYGDMGVYKTSYRLLQLLYKQELDIELLLHIGDLSYARGMSYKWVQWMNMISIIGNNIPYMVSIGNHEYDHNLSSNTNNGIDISGESGIGYHPIWGNMRDDSNGECGVPTYYRFKAPNNGNSIFWYSFNYKSVHFIILSSEHNYTMGSKGNKWLINDLKNVNNTLTPWIIVNIHRPLYCSQIYDEDNIVSQYLIEILEPILYEYKVDMVLTGHFHSYQRTCPVYNYTCVGTNNGGIVHIMIGSAGITLTKTRFVNTKWSEYYYFEHWGYGRFTANRTHLFCEYIRISDSKIMDSVMIIKNNSISKLGNNDINTTIFPYNNINNSNSISTTILPNNSSNNTRNFTVYVIVIILVSCIISSIIVYFIAIKIMNKFGLKNNKGFTSMKTIDEEENEQESQENNTELISIID